MTRNDNKDTGKGKSKRGLWVVESYEERDIKPGELGIDVAILRAAWQDEKTTRSAASDKEQSPTRRMSEWRLGPTQQCRLIVCHIILDYLRNCAQVRREGEIHAYVVDDYGAVTERTIYRALGWLVEKRLVMAISPGLTPDGKPAPGGYVAADARGVWNGDFSTLIEPLMDCGSGSSKEW